MHTFARRHCACGPHSGCLSNPESGGVQTCARITLPAHPLSRPHLQGFTADHRLGRESAPTSHHTCRSCDPLSPVRPLLQYDSGGPPTLTGEALARQQVCVEGSEERECGRLRSRPHPDDDDTGGLSGRPPLRLGPSYGADDPAKSPRLMVTTAGAGAAPARHTISDSGPTH